MVAVAVAVAVVLGACGDDGAMAEGGSTDGPGSTLGEGTFSTLEGTSVGTSVGPGADTSTTLVDPDSTTIVDPDSTSTGMPDPVDPFGAVDAIDLEIGFTPLSLEIGDFDGDDARDLLIAGTGGGLVVAATRRGDGAGGLLPAVDAGISACSAFPVTGALDDDGRTDTFFGTCMGQGVFYRGTESGPFATADVLAPWEQAQIVSSRFADVDGDGDDDLVLVTTATGLQFHVATHGDAPMWPVTSRDVDLDDFPANRFRVGDLDGDGALDAVVLVTDGLAATVADIAGEATATILELEVAPWSVALGDLDGDGDDDLIVASRGAAAVQVLLNDGAGTFVDAGTTPLRSDEDGIDPFEIVLGDFDGDGNVDVATIDAEAPRIAYALGTGSGEWGPWFSRPLSSVAVRVHAVDLDGDGRDELVAATFATDTVDVLRPVD